MNAILLPSRGRLHRYMVPTPDGKLNPLVFAAAKLAGVPRSSASAAG